MAVREWRQTVEPALNQLIEIDLTRFIQMTAYLGASVGIYTLPTLDSLWSGQPDEYRQALGNPNTSFAAPRYSLVASVTI